MILKQDTFTLLELMIPLELTLKIVKTLIWRYFQPEIPTSYKFCK